MPVSEIHEHLAAIYGDRAAATIAPRLMALVERQIPGLPSQSQTRLGGRLSERDSILITYGDQVREPGTAPLKTLADFYKQHLSETVSGIHILPFYPYSSDDGFSVIDYRAVDPDLGDWEDIHRIGQNFALMFDAVINHTSVHHAWFQAFLRGDPKYQEYFIVLNGQHDLSQVVRPRALPLLTTFDTAAGPRQVWTTFSDDQVDLNYSNPQVLLEVIETLLFYVSRGAEIIRLDAIAYLWKEIGTTCIHLPQTHRIIQLIRAVLEIAAPYVFLITETNVPHQENTSYFGDGTNEAHLVYNFALPPLVLHTFQTENAAAITHWAGRLALPSQQTTFFNFLASHDGIGLNPVREILSEGEIDRVVAAVQKNGGLVSYKNNPDGSRSPYELNISYFDALSDPNGGEAQALQVKRFLAAHAILLSLVGMPGIYFHSLFGSRSWTGGVARTGRNRTINRQKFLRSELERELADPHSLRRAVFSQMRRMLRARAAHPAFDPYGTQQVLDAGAGVFVLWRAARSSSERVLCLVNVTAEEQRARVSEAPDQMRDLLTSQMVRLEPGGTLRLEPYQSLWLTPMRI